MTLDLANLNNDHVRRNLAIMKQYISEVDPVLPIDRGPFHDLVLYYSSIFATANQQEIEDAVQAMNLLRLSKDAAKADPTYVDSVMSNWLVSRRKGGTASGNLILILVKPIGFVIPIGTIFTLGNLTFTTYTTYHVNTNTRMHSINDLHIQQLQSGKLYCKVPVKAEQTGADSNVRRGTQIKFDKQLLSFVSQIYIAEDFTGGSDEESNLQMFGRLTLSAGGKVWSNRFTCESLIAQHCDLRAVSIIGFGDPEMQRDKHSLWPGSTGGRTDVYVKLNNGITTKELQLPGKLVEHRQQYSVWQIELDRQTAAGMYYVDKVMHKHRSCAIKKTDYGFDTNGITPTPDIQTNVEAGYSSFRTVTLYVIDVAAAVTADESTFDLVIGYARGLDTLQTKLMDRSIASPAGDILVKAAVPCYVHIDIEIQRDYTDRDVPVAAIQNDISRIVNATCFVGHLSSTTLLQIIAPYLSGNMAIKSITLAGKLCYPNGKIEYLPAGNVLAIPNDPSNMVTARTTSFFQIPEEVKVTVTTLTASDT